MCLRVKESHVKTPIKVMKCYKVLTHFGGQWETPYQTKLVPLDKGGLFEARYPLKRKAEFKTSDRVEGGVLHSYIYKEINEHSYTKLPKEPIELETYYFRAYAYDVIAIGTNNDIVSKYLYIPAFDLRKGKNNND